MKALITIIICLLGFVATAQEKMNKFLIVDSVSNKAIPSTSVTIVRAKLSIATEKDGVFMIPGDLTAMRDTVIINSQNYQAYKIPLYLLDGMDTIRLAKYNVERFNEKLKLSNDTLLNKYEAKKVVHYAGLNTATASFDYLQMAQQFDVNQAGVVLKSIMLNRLAFAIDLSSSTLTGLVRRDKSKFRLRVYDIDAATKKPGRDLCSEIIEEDVSVGKQVSINLAKYGIKIPNNTFFVAVEWLRDYYNAGFSTVIDQRTSRPKREQNYRPTLGISPATGEKLNIWAMTYKHQWVPYTYFMPYGTDMAMSAVVAY
jgi:hypothetical protein